VLGLTAVLARLTVLLLIDIPVPAERAGCLPLNVFQSVEDKKPLVVVLACAMVMFGAVLPLEASGAVAVTAVTVPLPLPQGPVVVVSNPLVLACTQLPEVKPLSFIDAAVSAPEKVAGPPVTENVPEVPAVPVPLPLPPAPKIIARFPPLPPLALPAFAVPPAPVVRFIMPPFPAALPPIEAPPVGAVTLKKLPALNVTPGRVPRKL